MATNEQSEQRNIPSFVDFEIEIEEKDAQNLEYTISVLRSPSGEATETMKFPFGDVELESRLKDVQIALLRSTGERRMSLSAEAKTVQEFGRLLFNALMTGEVRNCYSQSQILARNEGKGLRVKLRINPPKLAALPWEFLYDSRQAEYICLSRNTPLVRYIDVPMPIQPIMSKLPLRVLGMVANPADQAPLKVSAEKKRVQDALAPLIDGGLVELTWLDGGTWQDLYNAMNVGAWHVFHFIGHGGYNRVKDEGTILLEDPSGGTDYMSATQLARLLADHPTMRLVVMNSCEGARGGKEDIFSSTASILLRRGIPAVLAMQYEITDTAAIAFSAHFYKALAEGSPVDAAVSGARISMSLLMDDSLEWATPVLYMRSQDGVLFRIDPSARPLPPKKREEPAPDLAEREKEPPESRREVVQPPPAVETPGRHVSPPEQPGKRIPPETTGLLEPPQTPRSGFLGGQNKFIWFGAGGFVLIFLCICLIFALVKLIPGPSPVTPVVDNTYTPIVVTDVPPPVVTVTPPVMTVTPPVVTVTPEPMTPTATPSPTPSPTLAPAEVIINYWNFFGDRNFEESWKLLSNGFRERNYKSNFDSYLADKNEIYCDVAVTKSRLLTETRANVYILATVNYKRGGACTDTPSMLVHQVTLSGTSWLLERVFSGVAADSNCSKASRRLSLGITARVVTKKDPLMVRAFPSSSDSFAADSQYLFDRLLPGTNVPVLDGPVCGKYNEAFYWWWKVRSLGGVEGWIVEGTDKTDPVFIKPAP